MDKRLYQVLVFGTSVIRKASGSSWALGPDFVYGFQNVKKSSKNCNLKKYRFYLRQISGFKNVIIRGGGIGEGASA